MRGWCVMAAAVFMSACSSDNTTGPTGAPPPVPTDLTSTSLSGAIALSWTDNAFTADPNNFQSYRVYSTTFNIDVPGGQCGTSWRLEGSTVSPEFIVGALTNGVPQCFAVSSVSVRHVESARSTARGDTPRPDARNVVVYASQVQDAGSGFRFWADLNGDGRVDTAELGLVGNGSDPNADFKVDRDGSGALFLTPVRLGTTVAAYGSTPVGDLTGIDFAPASGYARGGLEALPGWGYVFQMSPGGGVPHYGSVRTTHVGTTFLILDWAYQPDPGNPELKTGAKL